MSKKPQPPAKRPPEEFDAESQAIALEVARRIENLVPAHQRNQVTAQMVSLVQQERFSGPIAHPRHLREYDEICPGAADRIISMAEGNLAHSQSIQTTAINADIAEGRLGLLLGFAVLIILVGAAITAMMLGKEVMAGVFLGTAALGVVGKFINGRSGKPEAAQ